MRFKEYISLAELFQNVSCTLPPDATWKSLNGTPAAWFKDGDSWYIIGFKLTPFPAQILRARSQKPQLDLYSVLFHPIAHGPDEPAPPPTFYDKKTGGDKPHITKYARTRKFRAIPILAKVANIICAFAANNRPDGIAWHGADTGLTRLYNRMMLKLELPGYINVGQTYGLDKVLLRQDLALAT